MDKTTDLWILAATKLADDFVVSNPPKAGGGLSGRAGRVSLDVASHVDMTWDGAMLRP